MNTPWYRQKKGEPGLSRDVFAYVESVERQQSTIYDRFAKLDALYDPHGNRSLYDDSLERYRFNGRRRAQVSENLIASNVDTVSAVIASSEILPRFETSGGDWSTQRRARRLGLYAEGLGKKLRVQQTGRRCFKDGALKGLGLAKVGIDAFNRIKVERVLVDDVIVDELETGAGTPKQLHHRKFVDRDELKAMFPKFSAQIENAGNGRRRPFRWAGYRKIERTDTVVIESWRLPAGDREMDGYMPGRHVIAIDNAILLDEEYHKPFFPFARFAWSERTMGWYAIGLAERIAGIQRAVNKYNWQMEAYLDQYARPNTFVHKRDMNIAVKTVNTVGSIIPYSVAPPQVIIPNSIPQDMYRLYQDRKEAAYEEGGTSRLVANSRKPAGLDSAVALREYKDQTTQRFEFQQLAYEAFVVEIFWLALDACKDLAADGHEPPTVYRNSRYASRKFDWADVDMGEVAVELAVSSTLNRTPAGREQTVTEWAQAGLISVDEARRLIRHPDLERTMSIYTAAIEDIEHSIEEMLEGNPLTPEEYQNLKLGIWRTQMEYLLAKDSGAPEDVLENLRQWIVQAAALEAMRQQGPANANMPPAPNMPSSPTPAPAVAPQTIAPAAA